MSGPLDAAGRFFSQATLPLRNELAGAARNATDFFGNAADVAQDVAGAVVDSGHAVVDVAQDVAAAAQDVGAAVGEGAQDVAEAVGEAGIANVVVDAAKANLLQVGNIANQLVERTPADFVDWFIGPEGPSLADATRQVPGLQAALGDIMDKSMQNPMIAGAAGKAFGFEYVPGQDFYTTNESSIQSRLGFHDVYDKVGDLLGMDLDDKVVSFESGGVEYRVELWKGSYGSGGAFGGEIGIYTRHTGERGPLGEFLEQIPGYYSSAGGEDQIATTQEVYDTTTGEAYFRNDGAGSDDGKHFWNLAIRTDPGVNHEDIGQRGTLTMATAELAGKLCDGLNAQGVEASIQGDGLTVSYDWP